MNNEKINADDTEYENLTTEGKLECLRDSIAELNDRIEEINGRMVNDIRLWQNLFGIRLVPMKNGMVALQVISVKDERTDNPGLLAVMVDRVNKMWRKFKNEPEVSLPDLSRMTTTGEG